MGLCVLISINPNEDIADGDSSENSCSEDEDDRMCSEEEDLFEYTETT